VCVYGQGIPGLAGPPAFKMANFWQEGVQEAGVGELVFLGLLGVATVAFWLWCGYYIRLYYIQRHNLYISCRGPEMMVVELAVMALCFLVVVLREFMKHNPPGHRLSCWMPRVGESLGNICLAFVQVVSLLPSRNVVFCASRCVLWCAQFLRHGLVLSKFDEGLRGKMDLFAVGRNRLALTLATMLIALGFAWLLQRHGACIGEL
jgi:hypothetical protein